MPRIDRFIEAFFQLQATSLLAASSERVVLMTAAGPKPVTAQPATTRQLEELVQEIIPANRAASLMGPSGSSEFPYDSPSGRVSISVQREPGTFRIEVWPFVEQAAVPAEQAAVAVAGAMEAGFELEEEVAAPAEDPMAPVPLAEIDDEVDEAFEVFDVASSLAAEPEAPRPAAPVPPGPPAPPDPVPPPPSAEIDVALAAAAAGPAFGEAPPAARAKPAPFVPPPLPATPVAAPVPAAPVPAAPAPAATAPASVAAPNPYSGYPQPDQGPHAIDALFRTLVAEGCSDLHVTTGRPPLFRKDGEIVQLGDRAPLDAQGAQDLLLPIAPDMNRTEFAAESDTDFAYEIAGLARFRCNLYRDLNGLGGVFRVIPSKIPTAEELGLSPHILGLCDLGKGLVLVTGPTGSGKSTTLAAMIDYINTKRSEHIITIEDPVEFVHPVKKCLINQRQVGSHTESFKRALRAALREDPDIVLVGEMRDLETVAIAIETAETGHLVFGTLHTNTAPSTVDRIIDQFPADRQAQVRTMLSESLKGVISQTLLRRNGGGRVAAMEVLLVNSAISNLIREGKTFQIPSIMQTGKGQGMVTLNDSLFDLVTRQIVDPAEACAKAVARAEFKALLSRKGIEAGG